jgi:hypothetical protein
MAIGEPQDDARASRRVSSRTRTERVSEPVTPDLTDSTAELGAEGGSYGDLTQSVRSHRESAGGSQTWRFVGTVLLALLIVAALLGALVFWLPGE